MDKNINYTRRDFLQDSSKTLASILTLSAGLGAMGSLANAKEFHKRLEK